MMKTDTYIEPCPGGGTLHMKGVGMLVGNFELNSLRRPIWAWPNPFLTLKEIILNFHYMNRVNKTI